MLYRDISVSSSIVVVIPLSDAVDLAVHVGTMMISQLTTTWDMEGDLSWMPRTNTGNLSATTMSLTLEHLYSPPLDNTSSSLTLGDSDSVDELVGLEHVGDRDLLLEFGVSPVDLGSNIPTVDLDLHDVSFLEPEFEEFSLSVRENTDNAAIFLDAVESLGDVLLVLSLVFGESLVLRSHPVAVEPSLTGITEMLRPRRRKGLQATWSLDIPYDTNDDDGRGFEDCHGFSDLLAMHFRTRSVDFTHDVSHPGLVAHEGCKMWGLRTVVLWERTNVSSLARSSLAGKEAK